MQYGVFLDGYDDVLFPTIFEALEYVWRERSGRDFSIHCVSNTGIKTGIYSQSQVAHYIEEREQEEKQAEKEGQISLTRDYAYGRTI